jgi:hypothetical protein
VNLIPVLLPEKLLLNQPRLLLHRSTRFSRPGVCGPPPLPYRFHSRILWLPIQLVVAIVSGGTYIYRPRSACSGDCTGLHLYLSPLLDAA